MELLITTHNLCFCREIKKICGYPLLSGAVQFVTMTGKKNYTGMDNIDTTINGSMQRWPASL